MTESKTTKKEDIDFIGNALQRHFDFSRIPSADYEMKYYPRGRPYSFSVDEKAFVKVNLEQALSAYKRIKNDY